MWSLSWCLRWMVVLGIFNFVLCAMRSTVTSFSSCRLYTLVICPEAGMFNHLPVFAWCSPECSRFLGRASNWIKNCSVPSCSAHAPSGLRFFIQSTNIEFGVSISGWHEFCFRCYSHERNPPWTHIRWPVSRQKCVLCACVCASSGAHKAERANKQLYGLGNIFA